MAVSALISEARIQSGLTQTELALRAGTSQATLSKYESGEAVPTLVTLERILAAAGATLELTTTSSPRHLDVRRGVMALVQAKRKQIIEILAGFDMFNPAVFGSVARGEETETSDIDIMVDFDARKYGLMPLLEASDALQEILFQQIDVAPRSVLAEHVALHAHREAVPL